MHWAAPSCIILTGHLHTPSFSLLAPLLALLTFPTPWLCTFSDSPSFHWPYDNYQAFPLSLENSLCSFISHFYFLPTPRMPRGPQSLSDGTRAGTQFLPILLWETLGGCKVPLPPHPLLIALRLLKYSYILCPLLLISM